MGDIDDWTAVSIPEVVLTTEVTLVLASACLGDFLLQLDCRWDPKIVSDPVIGRHIQEMLESSEEVAKGCESLSEDAKRTYFNAVVLPICRRCDT